MAKTLGHDISKWQGDVNFDQFKDVSKFVILKASEGNGFTDPKFYRNQSEARRVGMGLGYYHFARPDLGNTPEAEAAWFLKVIGEIKKGEVLVLDYEPAWNGDAVGWCKKWLDYVTLRTNVKCLIYLNQSQVKNINWKPVSDAGYGLWIAAYTYSPDKNDFAQGSWEFAAMQQWSNKDHPAGISGDVDANVFFGDLTTFKKYGYQGGTTPPTPEKPVVEVDAKVYEHLVNGATVRKETAEYLEISDPDNAPTESIIRVIAGYKSRNTDLQTQLANTQAEVANREEQVSRLKDQVSTDKNTIDKLQSDLSESQGQVEAVRRDMQGKLDVVYKEKGALQIQLAECQSGNPTPDNLLIQLIKKILKALGK